MGLFRSETVLGIAEETLRFAREAAEDTHPNEFMGLLRAEEAQSLGVDLDGTIITEILFVPGTSSSPVRATMNEQQVANDRDAVGSIHSHPNGALRPSDTDLSTFGKGSVHIILGAPYGPTDWKAYDRSGERCSLRVFDVSLPDPAEQFFDVTQEDIDRELK